MKSFRSLGLILSLALITGASTGCNGFAKTIKATAGDPAIWHIKQNGWGNSIEIDRDGSPITNLPPAKVK